MGILCESGIIPRLYGYVWINLQSTLILFLVVMGSSSNLTFHVQCMFFKLIQHGKLRSHEPNAIGSNFVV